MSSQFKRLLDQVPNDVGGDGKKYAAAVKRFLARFSDDIDDRINGANGIKITSDGLHIENLSGAYALFNRDGVGFYNQDNELFAGLGRFAIGTAKDGQQVRFKGEWDVVPQVLILPANLKACPVGYSGAEVEIVCEARDVSKEGFAVVALSVLKAGAKGAQVLNEELVNVSVPEQSGATVSHILKPPSGATKVTANVSVFLCGTKKPNLVWTETTGADGKVVSTVSGIEEKISSTQKVVMSLLVNDTVVETLSYENTKGTAFMKAVNLNGTIKVGDTVTLRVDAFGTSTDETVQGSVQAVLDSISYEAGADYCLGSGDVVFIATDDFSLGSTVL